MNLRYNNYHKHTTKSSIFSPDTHIRMEEYFKRAKELGHTTYFTTEHGFGGDVFEALELTERDDFKNIKVIFALEGYIVPNPLEKDNSNYHIVLIARTDDARKKLNKINSRASREGYYYRPRIFIEDLLKLGKDDVYITNACVAGFLKDDIGFKEIFLPLYQHFGDSLLLETQTHNEPAQKEQNELILEMAERYKLKIVHANDSHYIYPEQANDRLEYLKGKGISYGDEDNYMLDYPDYDTIIERYKEQGVLSEEQSIQALENTLIFDECESIEIDRSIKMPNPYKDLLPIERYEKLRLLIYDKWLVEQSTIDKGRQQEYIDAIKFELDIIKDTNEEVHTADYFLLNEMIINKAVNEYDGKLTQSSRGSGGSYYINKLLGFTGIDRLKLNVPMYPTRFISKSRLLDSKSLPDFDFNTANPEPFIRATKDILGENGCHWMISYGTMQESEAFRNTCRNMGLNFNEYNDVAKDLDKYRNDSKWSGIIEHSTKFIDSIVSCSPHPCANIIMDKDIEKELGLIRVGDKLVAPITSKEADDWKYLKNDYLTVLVVEIINDTFEMLGKEIIPVNELIDSLDDRVWDLYEKGLTTTLNQTDSDFATNLIMKYKPRKYEELSAFVAAIRPGFASLLNTFIDRKEYTNGVDALDDLLKSTNHFMMYQENVMAYLVWLGIPEDITYDIVKKIAKKSFKEDELSILHEQLLDMWNKKVGTEGGFVESWKVVEDNAKYSFNASHSIAVAIDSLYGAYLKVNHPLEYYKVVLDKYNNDLPRTNRLVSELKHFDIELKSARFRHSGSHYTINREDMSIYKGISSIKNISTILGDELFSLREKRYNNFIELLYDIKYKTSCNSREIEILIKLDFFKEFGKAKKLLNFLPYFDGIYKAKVINQSKFNDKISKIISKHARKTESQYRDLDNKKILEEIWNTIPNHDMKIIDKVRAQREYLGYIDYTNEELNKRYVMVMNLDTKWSPKFIAYCLNNGKTQELKVYKGDKGRKQKNRTYFVDMPFKDGDLLYTEDFFTKPQSMKTDDGWIDIPNTKEWWLTKYRLVDYNVVDELINN